MPKQQKRRACRRMVWSRAAAVAALLAAPAAYAQEQTVQFDIASQPLSSALLELGEQARISIAAPSGGVNGRVAPALRGEMTVRAALTTLLEGTGLRFEFVSASAVRIISNDAAAPRRINDTRDTRVSDPEVDHEIVVVGTNIRGVYPASSPLEIFTAHDIERTGATTTEQFIQKLPQNLGTRTQYAATASDTAFNFEGVNSVDLRGLGVGTTLALLNGRRLPLTDNGQTADISLLPMGAIQRVEVLTDGASAIYGSDAIGGVVNFVLRDDFDGAESRFSYGGSATGGLSHGEFSHVLGRSWESGHVLGALSTYSASALDYEDRSYSAAAGAGTATPIDQRQSLLLTGSQSIGSRLTVSADVLASWRDVKMERTNLTDPNPANQSLYSYSSETTQWFAGVALDYELGEDSTLSVAANRTSVDVDGGGYSWFRNAGLQPRFFGRETQYTATELVASVTGSLLTLPGGQVRYSVGAGRQEEEYSGANAFGVRSTREIGRATSFAFAEALVPIVGPEQDVPLIRRLELSLAGRYTVYDDTSDPTLDREFGDGTNPKIGVLWQLFRPFSLRGTYGESFRAPSLSQLDPTNARSELFGGIPIPLAGGPDSMVLFLLESPAPQLEAEAADTFTIGFDLTPFEDRRFQVSGTYFNIDYTNRIATAAFVGTPFADPTTYSDVLYRPPSAAYLEEILRSTVNITNTPGVDLSDPVAAAALLHADPNFWLLDLRFRNLSTSELDGVDLAIRHRFATAIGDIHWGVQGTRLLSYRQQNSPSSPILSVVDTVNKPVDLRLRAFAGLSRGGFDGTVSVNYADDYHNPAALGGGHDVSSWTTVDTNLAYEFGRGERNGGLDGARFSLSIQNLLDEDPPLVRFGFGAGAVNQPVGFDPANANPLGRTVVLTVSKRW